MVFGGCGGRVTLGLRLAGFWNWESLCEEERWMVGMCLLGIRRGFEGGLLILGLIRVSGCWI